MVLIWIEALAGSIGLWPRRDLERRRGMVHFDPSWQVPAWRRRAPLPRTTAATPLAGAGSPTTARSRHRSVGSTPMMRRRCWVRVDPRDCGHAAIGGSFAEVYAALDRLAAIEESRSR